MSYASLPTAVETVSRADDSVSPITVGRKRNVSWHEPPAASWPRPQLVLTTLKPAVFDSCSTGLNVISPSVGLRMSTATPVRVPPLDWMSCVPKSIFDGETCASVPLPTPR